MSPAYKGSLFKRILKLSPAYSYLEHRARSTGRRRCSLSQLQGLCAGCRQPTTHHATVLLFCPDPVFLGDTRESVVAICFCLRCHGNKRVLLGFNQYCSCAEDFKKEASQRTKKANSSGLRNFRLLNCFRFCGIAALHARSRSAYASSGCFA